ncbi:MAG: thioredoxin [Candidatus Omnitrophota bacterium]|nr:thioredoxin [Candidatus Omnitrophota bacterium]RKY33572.1 MAG: thioredoxin [Candidatus Omnitrophota bacterium]RKY44760.1 MAG: thioredoxin [Candidatus Omnitrophota bacterium]HDN86150.1 thioredoxin [Candidatus Omnitrophota bacterium]
MEVKVDSDNFQEEVLNSSLPVLVDFWASWCAPCQMLAPIIDEVAKEYQGKLKVAKLNIEEAPQIATHYGIMSIPTLMIFKEGKAMGKVVGVLPKEEIIKFFQPYI